MVSAVELILKFVELGDASRDLVFVPELHAAMLLSQQSVL